MEKHISVLKDEVINALNVKEDGIYIDMTLGYAGHSREVLKRNKKGFLFAFDKDQDAIVASTKLLSSIGNNFKIYNSDNMYAKDLLHADGVDFVDGIIYDLGLSSAEIDEKERGFSYIKDAKLDMRMDKSAKLKAYDVVNYYSKEELIRIFREYGEEPCANRIANNIVASREKKPINTTLELVDIIDKSVPYKLKRNSHPAKRVFQAIRIEVNNELEGLKVSLKNALSMLNKDGILAVITFHSLEDRIVKKMFKEVTEIDPFIKGMPNIDISLLPDYELVNNKPILPSKEEIENNPRAHSAKLRIIKKIK